MMHRDEREDEIRIKLYPLREEEADKLKELSVMLSKVGVTMEVERSGNETKNTCDKLTFRVNQVQYEKSVTRHAGRKSTFSDKCDRYGECTVEELQKKLSSMSKVKVAEELGCSRMTLYRILRNLSEVNPEGYMSIWHYM